MNGPWSVVLVFSVAHAIRLERLLKGRATGCRLIPVPRHLSSDCGVCVRVRREDVPLVAEVLAASALEIDAVHDLA